MGYVMSRLMPLNNFMKNRITKLSEEETLELWITYGTECVVLDVEATDYDLDVSPPPSAGYFVKRNNGFLFDNNTKKFINKPIRPTYRDFPWGVLRRRGLFQNFIGFVSNNHGIPYYARYGQLEDCNTAKVLNSLEGKVDGGLSVAFVDPEEHDGNKFYVFYKDDSVSPYEPDTLHWVNMNGDYIRAYQSDEPNEITISSANYGLRCFNEFWKLTPEDEEYAHPFY